MVVWGKFRIVFSGIFRFFPIFCGCSFMFYKWMVYIPLRETFHEPPPRKNSGAFFARETLTGGTDDPHAIQGLSDRSNSCRRDDRVAGCRL
jgi:hypothetical protein